MSALVMRGSSLGSVARRYEEKNNREYIVPQHRRDDTVNYMRANADDKLEVVAACWRHTAMQPRNDLKKGLYAPCPHGDACKSHRRYDVERPNVRRKKRM